MEDILGKISFLKGIDKSKLKQFVSFFTRRTYPEGSIVVEQDEAGDSLYVITRGKAKVIIMGEDGREVLLSILKEGDFFGEMSVIDKKPRSASVVALEECEFISISREYFLEMVRVVPEIALRFMSVMSERLRKADARIENLALLDVYGRIARYLLELGANEGKLVGGDIVVDNPPKQLDIAASVSASRETVSRVMTNLQRQGYITYEPGKKLIIHEPIPPTKK